MNYNDIVTVLILLSVHSLASSLASLVTSSDDSAIALAMEMRSLLLPLSSCNYNSAFRFFDRCSTLSAAGRN